MTREPKRFWSKVDTREPNECWEWQASLAGGGYGQFNIHGKMWRAHRVVWVLTYGPIPEGLLVCHTCDNKTCCNPYHLFLGTPADNQQDSARKGRRARKLTEEDVLEIRELLADGFTQEEVANLFGVNNVTISRISRGTNWSWLK